MDSFWPQVLQNFLGNLASDLITGVIFGSFAVFYITKYFEIDSEIKNNIGALTLIEAELQINQHMLNNIKNVEIVEFEKIYGKGTPQEDKVKQEIFDDAIKFMKISTDAILSNAFNASYIGIGNLRNKKLLNKILNLYMIEFHYRIQTAFRMGQLNWKLLETIKNKLNDVTDITKQVRKEIDVEIKNLNKISVFNETFVRLFYLFKR